MNTVDAVAIDGPAGAGKSTIARAVASALDFLYIDTGAMYRAVTLAAIEKGVELEDPEAMGEVAQAASLAFDDTGTKILLNGRDVSQEIRSPDLTARVRYAARALPVRDVLVRRQQALAHERPVVMEGRDITTVVLKDARWKFFLTASAEERARRRLLEFEQAGHAVSFDTLLQEIQERDASDFQVGALKNAQDISRDPAGDIVAIDTTGLTPQEIVSTIVSRIQNDREGA